jgi:hypothetical protein
MWCCLGGRTAAAAAERGDDGGAELRLALGSGPLLPEVKSCMWEVCGNSGKCVGIQG